jgi:hypothetical protein
VLSELDLVSLARVGATCTRLYQLAQAGLEKKPGLKKNPAQWFFFGFLFFSVFLYICLEERVFRVFSVSRTLLGASRH